MLADIDTLFMASLPATAADLRNRTGLSRAAVSRRLSLLIKAKTVCPLDNNKRPKVFIPCLPDGSPSMSRAPAMLIEKVTFTAPARHYLFALYGG